MVNIRSKDLLEVSELNDLNFNNQIWIKSISKLCEKNLLRIYFLSDSKISKLLINSLKDNDLNVLIPDIKNSNVIVLELFSLLLLRLLFEF